MSPFAGNSLILGRILKGRFTFSVILYVIKSNDPSGGINVMALSLSNFGSLTHWWNLISSIEIPLSPYDFFLKTCQIIQQKIYFFGSLYINNLSFIPNLHSGIPDNLHLQLIFPVTSALRIVFLSERVTFTFSITSMNTSFFLWYMFGFLQEVSPVA